MARTIRASGGSGHRGQKATILTPTVRPLRTPPLHGSTYTGIPKGHGGQPRDTDIKTHILKRQHPPPLSGGAGELTKMDTDKPSVAQIGVGPQSMNKDVGEIKTGSKTKGLVSPKERMRQQQPFLSLRRHTSCLEVLPCFPVT